MRFVDDTPLVFERILRESCASLVRRLGRPGSRIRTLPRGRSRVTAPPRSPRAPASNCTPCVSTRPLYLSLSRCRFSLSLSLSRGPSPAVPLPVALSFSLSESVSATACALGGGGRGASMRAPHPPQFAMPPSWLEAGPPAGRLAFAVWLGLEFGARRLSPRPRVLPGSKVPTAARAAEPGSRG